MLVSEYKKNQYGVDKECSRTADCMNNEKPQMKTKIETSSERSTKVNM